MFVGQLVAKTNSALILIETVITQSTTAKKDLKTMS